MNEKLKKYLLQIIKYIVILTIVLNIISFYKSQDLNKQKLPLTKLTLLDDSKFNIKPNKPILIYFWATWCPTCKVSSSNIQRLSKDYEVLTIAVDSGTKESISQYIKKNNYTFKVYNDFDGTLSNSFNVQAYPTTFIYGKNKDLKFTDVGYTSTFGLYLRMIFSTL